MQNNKTKQQIGRKKKQTNILMGWTNNFSRNYTNGYLEHLYTYNRSSRNNRNIDLNHFLDRIRVHEQYLQENASLRLKFTIGGDISCLHLCYAHFPYLTHLDLYNSKIGDEGCRMLAKSDWKYLKVLQLGGNMITERGCFHLSHGNWKYLIHLDLNINPIGRKGFVCICNAFSFQCKIYCDLQFGQFYL